jgi:hypothetical protein
MRDHGVNTDRGSGGFGWCNQIHNNVQRATLWVVGDAIFGFSLDVVGGASKARKGARSRRIV